MSKYTTEVRFILENDYMKKHGNLDASPIDIVKDSNFLNVDDAIDFSIDVSTVISDDVRRQLNKGCNLLLLHNYTREIGFETVGLWKFKMQSRLNEIVPYYAELYQSVFNTYDPFIDTDVTTTKINDKTQVDTHSIDVTTTDTGTKSKVKTDEGSSSSDGSNNDVNKEVNKYSETPQSSLLNVEAGTYLTNARVVEVINNNTNSTSQEYETSVNDTDSIDLTNKKTGTNQTTIDNDETDTITVKGKTGPNSYAQMIRDYRKSIINVNEMFIKEFNDLFMVIW